MHHYLRRARTDASDSLFTGVYHILNGNSSICEKVTVGVNGFNIVERDKPVLAALICMNCQLLARAHGKR